MLAAGSDVQYLTRDIDGTLYAYGKGLTYTLYRSTDNGHSWAYIGNVQDAIVDIALAPGDASIIYYATKSAVFRSTDGGDAFQALPPAPGGAGSGNVEITSLEVARYQQSQFVAVATKDTDAAQFGGVYLLDESQAIPSWTDTGLTGYDVYAVALSPNYGADRQAVTIVTDETDTFVTTKYGNGGWGATTGNAKLNRDNSLTHTPVPITSSAVIAFTGEYDALAGDWSLFIGIDTGSGNGDVYRIDAVPTPGKSIATDLNIGSVYSLVNVDVTGLAGTGNAATATLVAGGAAAQVYYSADGGTTWARSRKRPTGDAKTFVVVGKDEMFAATSGTESALSISTDKGANWSQIGLIDTTISTLLDVAPSPVYSQDSTLFLLSFGGKHSLWRSLNDGRAWERVFSSALPNVDSVDLIQISPQYGKNGHALFVAGRSAGRPCIWLSTDGGQTFTRHFTNDPSSGAAFNINAWTVLDNTTLFVGSFDGTKGRVYKSTNGGFFYSNGTAVGSQPVTAIFPSPAYEKDKTLLASNNNGWAFLSTNEGKSFEPLPRDAVTAPLSGSITIAFDLDFSQNSTVYAASSTANKGVYRFVLNGNAGWERIDSTLPSGGTINRLAVSPDGTIYAANSKAGGGMERSLNPTYALGPAFETVTRGLSDTATLLGLWWRDGRLWAIDSTGNSLLSFADSLTQPGAMKSPADKESGVGSLINHTVTNVTLDWQTFVGATDYSWQIDHDTDFSSVPAGYEGTTKGSTVRLPALDSGTTYYWRIRATQPVLSPWSATWSFSTVLDTEPLALSLQSPGAGATGVSIKPLFQWTAVASATAYELSVADDASFAKLVFSNVIIP